MTAFRHSTMLLTQHLLGSIRYQLTLDISNSHQTELHSAWENKVQAYACRPELPIFTWENKVQAYACRPELPTFFGENKAPAYYAWRPELPISSGENKVWAYARYPELPISFGRLRCHRWGLTSRTPMNRFRTLLLNVSWPWQAQSPGNCETIRLIYL